MYAATQSLLAKWAGRLVSRIHPSSPQCRLARPLSFQSAIVINSAVPATSPELAATGFPHSVPRPTGVMRIWGTTGALSLTRCCHQAGPQLWESPTRWEHTSCSLPGAHTEIPSSVRPHCTEAHPHPPGEDRCSLQMARESLQGKTTLTSQGHRGT